MQCDQLKKLEFGILFCCTLNHHTEKKKKIKKIGKKFDSFVTGLSECVTVKMSWNLVMYKLPIIPHLEWRCVMFWKFNRIWSPWTNEGADKSTSFSLFPSIKYWKNKKITSNLEEKFLCYLHIVIRSGYGNQIGNLFRDLFECQIFLENFVNIARIRFLNDGPVRKWKEIL